MPEQIPTVEGYAIKVKIMPEEKEVLLFSCSVCGGVIRASVWPIKHIDEDHKKETIDLLEMGSRPSVVSATNFKQNKVWCKCNSL